MDVVGVDECECVIRPLDRPDDDDDDDMQERQDNDDDLQMYMTHVYPPLPTWTYLPTYPSQESYNPISWSILQVLVPLAVHLYLHLHC